MSSPPQRAHSAPSDPKSRLHYLLHDTPPPTTPTLAGLSLQTPSHRRPRTPPPMQPPLPILPPLRARSADTLPPPLYTPPRQASSTLSAVTPVPERPLSGSGPSLLTQQPSQTLPCAPYRPLGTPGGRRGSGVKSEAELRDKRELRRMKNRISAARSRQRKTDTFETLQRELAEAKAVIEALTLQLEQHRTPPVCIAVPQDLRRVVGRDFVSADALMDLLRMYIHRESQRG